MDIFLGKVTQQAMNYAIRSGIALTATYAIRQSNRLLSNAPRSTAKDELYALQQRLQHKIRIISPAIDMIELIAARGNTSLESAIALTKELRLDIQSLGQRLASAAQASESTSRTSQANAAARAQQELELKGIVVDIKALLGRIEDALPLINLAITTSGVSLSTNLPHTVSPSRLLQSSTFLTAGDTQYAMSPHAAVQIGPTFTLTIYMLFTGHNRPQSEEDIRETTWKEVMHKARVKIRRVPFDVLLQTGSRSSAIPSEDISSSSHPVDDNGNIPAEARSDEFAYQLLLVEDFDDDRVHDFEGEHGQPGSFEDVPMAGIREVVPIHQISKIFYADTSKVLNIGTDAESNNPVLLLKRDINAIPPRRMAEREHYDATTENGTAAHQEHSQPPLDSDPWRFPPSLDPEWIAFEVYTEAQSDDDLSEPGDVTDTSLAGLQPTPSLDEHIASMHISTPPPTKSNHHNSQATSSSNHNNTTQLTHPATTNPPPPWQSQIKTSLSLLELLLRLTSLQQFQQQSHLSITDELLNFFLEESASTGAGGDEHYRQAVRADARRRVGWDPYDESPMKRRGEDYQYGGGGDGGGNSVYSPGGSQGGWQSMTGDGVDEGRRRSYNEGWSPRSVGAQTRSITRVGSQSPGMGGGGGGGVGSASPLQGKGREQWLRRKREKGRISVGSPLRPSTGRSDEGLGTSPVSAPEVARSPREG